MERLKLWLEEQSKGKLTVACLLIIGVIALIFLNPYDKKYYKEVAEEITIARRICEIARTTVLNDRKRWNFRNNELNDIPVDGKIPVFKYINYPIVDYNKNSYNLPGQQRRVYCYIKDPRGGNESGSSAYYYDFRNGTWN